MARGSTAAMLSSILAQEGMNVGLYTSPHLCDFRERIRVNNEMIPEDTLYTLIDKVREEIRENITYSNLPLPWHCCTFSV